MKLPNAIQFFFAPSLSLFLSCKERNSLCACFSFVTLGKKIDKIANIFSSVLASVQYLFQLFNEWVWNPFVFDTQWNTQIIVDQYYVQNANCISINATNPIEYMNRPCAWLKMQSFTPPQLHHVAELNNEKKWEEWKKLLFFFIQSLIRFFNQSRHYDAADENN